MNKSTAFESIHLHYSAREQVARDLHSRGEKVIGYLSNNVPVELIIAAGMFPVQLTGSPAESTETADHYMEDFFDGDIRSIFNRILIGHFEFVDLLIIPRTSEGMLQLYYFLKEVSRLEPDRRLPEILLFDLLHTAFWRTGRYNLQRVVELKRKLEQLASRPITPGDLANAIRLTNRNRALLSEINGRRRRDPCNLTGSDMLRIIATSMFMDMRTHTQALEVLLSDREPPPVHVGPRLMIKGSPHDNPGFYELVESCGAVVAADDHVWSERLFEHKVREDDDPIEALTEHYHLHSVSPRQYPQSRQDSRFMELVSLARVQGVVFYFSEWDDTLGWDYPEQKKLLDRAGIPSICMTRQSYRQPDEPAQQAAVQALVDLLCAAGSTA